MPDICMCHNKECKQKKECYRYMATPSGRQSYSTFPRSKDEDGNCNNFIKHK